MPAALFLEITALIVLAGPVAYFTVPFLIAWSWIAYREIRIAFLTEEYVHYRNPAVKAKLRRLLRNRLKAAGLI